MVPARIIIISIIILIIRVSPKNSIIFIIIITLLPESTGNTQEALDPSRNDWKLMTGTLNLNKQTNKSDF